MIKHSSNAQSLVLSDQLAGPDGDVPGGHRGGDEDAGQGGGGEGSGGEKPIGASMERAFRAERNHLFWLKRLMRSY